MNRFLLVDDDPLYLNVMQDLLKVSFKKATVDLAEDGEEGLLLTRKNEYDLIIVDYKMPTMNGGDFIKEVMKIDSNIEVPFLIISGFETEAKTIQSEYDCYLLLKPVRAQDFVKTVKLILSSHKKQKSA